MMRRIALALALVLTLSAGDCDAQKSDDGKPSKAAAPPVVQPPNKGGEGNAQPAPVQGDPSAHNQQAGHLTLQVRWFSENRLTPACEWSLNSPGRGNPCANMEKPTKSGNRYFGLWEHDTTAKAGDVVWLAAQSNVGFDSTKCSYFWKGQLYDFPGDGKHCGGTVTLP